MNTNLPRAFCARFWAVTLPLAASLGLQAQTTPADDHGNTTSTATAVALPSVKTGSLEKAGDIDFFKFTLTAPSGVTLTSSGTTDVTGTLWLGAAKGTATSIVTDNDSAGAPNFRVRQLLPAGTHYLNVFPAVYGTLGDYTVNFSVDEPSAAQPDVTLGFKGADLPAGSQIDFGTAAPGGTVTRDFSVGNAGDAPLTIYGVRLILNGTLPAGSSFPFRIVTSPAPTVDPGRQTTFRIAFQSSVAATYTGKLSVVSNDGDEIFYDLPMRGVSSGPLPPAEIAIRDGATILPSNATIHAGSTPVNTRLNKTITIANLGTGELRITGSSLVPVSTTAPSASNTTIPMAFSLYNSTIPTSIPAGGQATFQISLFNLVAGNYAAKLTLSNNDSDENPTIINFTGAVSPGPVQGEIGLTVGGANVTTNGSVAYGDTVTGVGVTKDFVFTNSGTATLNLTSWQLVVPPPVTVPVATTTMLGSDIAIVASSSMLAPGMGISGPFPPGTFITGIAGNTVKLSGPATVAITNAVLHYYVAGPNATVNAFRFDSSLPASLAAGASATLKVTYLPLQTGDHTVALKVYNTDADENPFTVTLTGHCDVNPNPGDIAIALNGADVARDSSVDWGSVPVGMTALKHFTVTNTGSGELRLTSFVATPVQPVLTGTTPLYFYFGGTPSQVLPAGQSGSLVMIFKPAVADTAYRTTLIISSTDPDENPYRINLTGTSVASTTPVADVDLAVNGGLVANNGSFAFGTVNSGTAVQKSLTIYNTGNAPLTITGATVTQPVGTPAGTQQPFSMWVTPPMIIAPGTSSGTWLNFAPTAAGTYSATVQLFSNDPDESPYTINISGTAAGTVAAPEIGLSLAGVDVPAGSGVAAFGDTASGTPVSKQFTITNTGDAALALNSWMFQQPGGTTTTAQTTTTVGSNVATVTNASALVVGMTVGGPFPTGTAVVSISGNSLTFSAAATTTGTNTLVTYFQPGVPVVNPFQFTGTLPSSVAAGASATFTITYSPLSAGNHSMVARFGSNDISENPYFFTVTGAATGVAPQPEIGITVGGQDVPLNGSVAYGSTSVGSPVSKQFVINNTGNAALTLSGWSFMVPGTPVVLGGSTMAGQPIVTLSSTSGLSAGMVVVGPFPTGTTVASLSGNTVVFSAPSTSTVSNTTLSFYPAGTNTLNAFQFSATPPTTVAAGGSATVTINYAPSAAGSHSMRLRVNTNDSNENPYLITLNGSATAGAVPEIGVSSGGSDVPLNGTLGFGTTAAGTPVSKQLVIANTGTAALNLSGYGFYLTSSATNVVTSTTFGSSVASVTSSANLSAGMVVAGPFAPGTSIVSISGTSVTFSSAATATTSAQSLAYYPAGTSTVNPFQFSGALPSSVAAGATATITVNYAPATAGTHSMVLRFTNNDSNENPYSITVTGSATAPTTAPEISVFIGTAEQPINSTLDFGTIARGTTATKDLVIRNTGAANLTISNVISAITPAASGSNTTPAFGWQIISGTNTVVPAGSATVRVTFKPGALSTNYSSAYRINNNDSDENPYGFTLTGASLATDSEVSVSHNDAELPSNGTITWSTPVAVGSMVTKSYTITNTGAAVLVFSGWSVTPASGSYPTTTLPPFYITGLVPSLAPGASAIISVVYRPMLVSAADNWVVTMTNSDADEGLYKINLTSSSVASATPSEVGVSVGGTDVAAGGSLSFNTGVNVAVTRDIIISNTGAEPLLIGAYWTANTAPAGLTAFTTVQAPPSSIAPGSTAVWKVRFLPTVAGSAFTAKLTLHNTDPDESSYVINLTGSTTP